MLLITLLILISICDIFNEMKEKELYQMSKAQKEEIKKKLSSFLQEKAEISFAYFFGSFLEEEPIAFRDVDIGIFLNPLTIKDSEVFDYETSLAIQLSRIISFPADRLDIKILNFASKMFQNNVFSRGELIFARDFDLLTSLIESASQEAVSNYEFSKQSLRELIT